MWTRIVASLLAVALLAGCASDESRAEQLCVQAAVALESDDPQRAGLALSAVQGLLWRSDRLTGRGFDTELADQMAARCPYELGAVLLVLDQQDATPETTSDVYRPYLDAMRTASPDPTLLNPEPQDDDGPFDGLSGIGWGLAALVVVMLGLRLFEVAVRAPARRRHAYWETEANAARDAREAREAAEALEGLDAGEGDAPDHPADRADATEHVDLTGLNDLLGDRRVSHGADASVDPQDPAVDAQPDERDLGDTPADGDDSVDGADSFRGADGIDSAESAGSVDGNNGREGRSAPPGGRSDETGRQ